MNADGSPAVGADVRFGVEVHRAFGISLVTLGAGIVVLALGLTLTLRRPVAAAAPITGFPVVALPAARRAAPTPAAAAAAHAAASAEPCCHPPDRGRA